MHYSIQFVGLACFHRDPGTPEERCVLLPDGRDPGDGIEPHFASIVVASDAVEEAAGWTGEEVSSGVFGLPPCSIVFEGADTPGLLDSKNHDGLLPQLRRMDPNFTIDRTRAQTIATVRIRRGTLTAYGVPGGTAVISQLDVPHDGNITVTITPRDGSSARSIRLKPGTEIVLKNTARDYRSVREPNAHFRIYERLSASPGVRLNEPETPASVPRSPSRHTFFMQKEPAGLAMSCSNTGCCD
jgi:hypothetical protein